MFEYYSFNHHFSRLDKNITLMYHTKYSIIILNTKRQKKTIKCSMTEKLSLKKDQKNTTLQKKWFESHIGATMH